MDPLALFDLPALKAHCKISAADGTRDAILSVIGNAASAYCEARVGQQFKPRVYTIERSGDGTTKLLRLPRPIISVESLSVDGMDIAPSEYFVYAEAGKIQLRTRTFRAGVGNVRVILNAGYDETHPRRRQITAAALDLAKSHYDEWDANAISATSISVGPQSMVIRPGLNPRIEKFLDSIRDVRG
ncbi:MAG TPA: hypothetical protein VM364_00560 [Vicinamibacterales bacterium]|nr:hypothetical protein [Vicinamibacterales bacterium]